MFYLFAAVVLLLQPGCSIKKPVPEGLWFYAYTSGTNESHDGNISPASFINLQPDNSYTRDFGRFDYGHWEEKDSVLLLKTIQGDTMLYPVKYFYKKQLELVTISGKTVSFERQPGKFSNDAENPFSVENNQWRIPPAKKETGQELKNRLRNHCRFYEIYFRWALANGLNTVDVRSTSSLIRIYGNGFAVKEFNDLPPAWHTYFYDEDDCYKANDILKDIFEHKDIAWSQTNNKYKMFISAFQQLQQYLQ